MLFCFAFLRTNLQFYSKTSLDIANEVELKVKLLVFHLAVHIHVLRGKSVVVLIRFFFFVTNCAS